MGVSLEAEAMEPSVRVVWEPGFTESDLDSTSMEADPALCWVKNMCL